MEYLSVGTSLSVDIDYPLILKNTVIEVTERVLIESKTARTLCKIAHSTPEDMAAIYDFLKPKEEQ